MIAQNHELAREWTISGKLIAVITDGSAVLVSAIWARKRACQLLKAKLYFIKFGGVDAIPLALEQNQLTRWFKQLKIYKIVLQNPFRRYFCTKMF